MTPRRLQRRLQQAGATVSQARIADWTPSQCATALHWANDQIAAHEQDAPGSYTSVKWPGFLGEAATNKRRA